MEDNVSRYIGQALAPSTLRSYESGQRRYLKFCNDASLPLWPLTEHSLCLFVAHLGSEGLTHQTIKCYLSSIRFLSISTGRGDPFSPGALPLLQYVLRGVRRTPRLPRQSRNRLPITPSILRTVRSQWAPNASNVDYVMMWAACCVGFFGFLRAGEFTARTQEDFDPSTSITLQDVAVDQHDNPSMIRIRLKQSKTDPFRHGVDVFLGRTQADLCPVSALLAFVAVRPDREGPLFVFQDGSFLTRDRLVMAVRATLQSAGVDASGYSGHSFRIGAATTAARRGVEDSTIKTLGRWESAAYQRYIQMPRHTLASVSARLVGTNTD